MFKRYSFDNFDYKTILYIPLIYVRNLNVFVVAKHVNEVIIAIETLMANNTNYTLLCFGFVLFK